jgi:hypothetical protein
MSVQVSARAWPAPSGPLTVLTLHSGLPGPRLAIVANVHGDEPAGTFACLRIAAELGGQTLRGALILVPSANPTGLARRSRRVPEDDQDLNRAFPGDPEGGPTARHAAALWALLREMGPDALLDLHADSPESIPYALVDRSLKGAAGADTDLEARAVALAHATGVAVVHEFPRAVYARMRLERSLAGAALNTMGIPSVTLETGSRHDPRGRTVEVACAAVRGVLTHLAMLPVPDVPAHDTGDTPTPRWTRALGPRVRREGLLQPTVAAGVTVPRGTPIARVLALDGRVRETLEAPSDGMTLAWVEGPWVAADTVACTWAEDGTGCPGGAES